MNKYIVLILLIINISCKKINYFPDKFVEIESPKVLAHRGGRTSTLRENHIESIKAAMKTSEGIEVDVQISKDETIWLSHEVDIKSCGQNFKCFPETRDADIRSIKLCNGQDISYTELEDVYKFLSDSFPKAYIAIDLKGWVPCSVNSVDIEGMMRREALIIMRLAEKYGMLKNTLFETETSSVLTYILSVNPKTPVFQTSYGDFERAMLLCLNYGYTGISYKTNVGESLDKEKMDMLHRKGLKLIAWNLLDKKEVEPLKSFGVDYIQLDL